MTWNQSLLKLRMLNFHNLKEAHWYWKPFLRNSSLKIGPLWHGKIGDFWDIVVQVYEDVFASTCVAGKKNASLLASVGIQNCNAVVYYTIFGRSAKNALRWFSPSGLSVSRHLNAVIGVNVQSIQLNHLSFRLLALKPATSLCKNNIQVGDRARQKTWISMTWLGSMV